MIHKTTISGTCPAGFCEYIQEYSVHLIVVLCIDIFIFFVTLVPPLFNWSTKKPDGKKRIYFAALACITFYFWLIFLAVNSLYCFGFMAHMGPCINQTRFESSTKKPSHDFHDDLLRDDGLTLTPSPNPLVISDDIISTLSNDRPRESVQNQNDNFIKSLPSTLYFTKTTSRSKRQTESNLEHPPNTLPPLSSPTRSSSSFSFPSSGSPSSAYENHLSSSSSTRESSNRSFRDMLTSLKYSTNSTSSIHSSLPTLFASSSNKHVVPSSLGLTSLPTYNFYQTNKKEVVEDEDDGDYDDVSSGYGIMAQALKGGIKEDPVEDCITTTTTEAPAPAIVEHETELKNLFYAHVLILVVLFVVLVANAKEAITAKALYHKETLCKKDEVQRFLSSLVIKKPEVGHLVNCFHMAKPTNSTTNTKGCVAKPVQTDGAKTGNQPKKVITFSTIDNFGYQNWRDFSDSRLIDPSKQYPIIEIVIALNFFPGDHFTAERYKSYVTSLTKEHSGKDQRITIDDYFHIEDHREWVFFVGKEEYITPWWAKDPARFILGCIFLFNWPFRMSYKGRIAKHNVEVKKAVFVENTSQDEGVSLSATPGSSNAEQQVVNSNPTASNNTGGVTGKEAIKEAVECNSSDKGATPNEENNEPMIESSLSNNKPSSAQKTAQHGISNNNPQNNHRHSEVSDEQMVSSHNSTSGAATNPGTVLKHNEHLVDAVISHPPHSDINPSAPFMQHQDGNPTYVAHENVLPQKYIQQRHQGIGEVQGSTGGYQLQQQQQQFYQHQQHQHTAHSYSKQQTTLGPSIHNLQSIAGGGGSNEGSHHQTTSINNNAAPNLDNYRSMQPPHHSILAQTHPLAHVLPGSPPMPPQRSVPLRSPRTNLRETTKDIVTAVTHQDINGVSAVNTVAVKDIDVQLSALSGYETYV